MQRCPQDFTVGGLVAELAERGLKVDYRTRWEFVHAEKLRTLIATEQDRPDVARRRAQWTKYRDRIDPTRLVFIDGPGPKPIWRRCGAGHRAVNASKPRCRTAAGRP
jgi:hypothetical protein